MIYRIVCDGVDIYGDTVERSVLKPHLEIELNSAGSLEFTLPKDNEDPWNFIGVFKNEIEVWENDEIIWFGRPLQITRDWNNQKKVVCEGALAYFNDTLERTNEVKPTEKHNVVWFFNQLIESYNSQVSIEYDGSIVDDGRQFTVGTVDIEDSGYIYRKTDYQTTMECLQQMCLDTDGGYFILRKEYDSYGVPTRYIDWVREMPYGSDQDVIFGLNLLDITQDLNGADICTVLVPSGADDLYLNKLGTKDPDENEGVGHYYGSDEIWYKPGVEVYGRVLKTEMFSDYDTKEQLWTKAHDWLIEKNKDIPTIEVDAADLHYIREYEDRYSNFKVGMSVLVNSSPHDLNNRLIIYKLSMDLDSGIKKVTIGTPPKRELTDIIAPSSGGGTTRGTGGSGNSGDGGSSGSGNVVIPVKDVKVKKKGDTSYSSVVSKKIAKIDLSDTGTEVIPNPTGEPTNELETIQIGDVVYDIPSGGGGGGGQPVYLNTIYDDTERQVGYYYGRPLYQRTWDLGANFSFSNNSWTTIAEITGLSDIILVNSLGSQDPSDTAVAKFDTWFDSSNNTIKVRSLRTDNEYVRYITLQYAKNTDSVDPNPQIGNIIYLPSIYSEEERQVGVWTDGKPLYQKTWNNLSYTVENTNWINFITVPNGIDLIDAKFYGKFANDLYEIVCEEAHIDSATGTLEAWFRLANTRTVKTITLRYTKTTDTTGSGNWTPDGAPAHHYSLNEHIIGTWYDGSTLWEKTIVVGTPTHNAYTSYSHGISNLGKLVNAFGSCTNNGSNQLNVPLPNMTSQYSIFLGNVNSTVFYYQFGSGFNAITDFVVTLQYTKSS